MSMSWCQVCGSADMTVGIDGSYFCQSCGAQSLNHIEEAFDDVDVNVFTTRFLRETRVARNEQQEMHSQVPPEILGNSQVVSIAGSQIPGVTQEPYLGSMAMFDSLYGSRAGTSQPTEELGSQFGLVPRVSQSRTVIDRETLSNSIRKTYVEGVQKILMMQCETLVKDFGATPLICGIAGSVWLRYVASSRVYQKSWADEVLEVAEDRERKKRKRIGVPRRIFQEPPEMEVVAVQQPRQRGAIRQRKPRKPRKRRGQVEPRTSYGRRARFVWLSALKERIPLSITLGLCYLACYMARETVLPTDIRKWALKGKLPYLAAFIEISKPSPNHIPNTVGGLKVFPIEPRVMFKPLNMVGATTVELLAGHIAKRINLQLPPVNYHGLSARLLRELKLPIEKLTGYVERLYEWYCPSGLWLSVQNKALPTRIYVMAMLMIVFKVLYKLDGRVEKQTNDVTKKKMSSTDNDSDHPGRLNMVTRTHVKKRTGVTVVGAFEEENEEDPDSQSLQQKKADGGNDDEQENMDVNGEDLEDCNTDLKFQEKEDEVWNTKDLLETLKIVTMAKDADPRKKLAEYLKYCRDVIFSGQTRDADEEVIRDHFWEIYEKHANETIPSKQQGESEAEGSIEKGKTDTQSAKEADGISGDDDAGRNRYPPKLHGSVGSAVCLQKEPWQRSTSNDKAPNIEHEGQDKEGVNQEQEQRTGRSDRSFQEYQMTQESERLCRERDLRMLIKDMKDTGFSCLPAVRHVVSSNKFLTYSMRPDSNGLMRVHEEYFIALRACAKLIKVHPKALHFGVQTVESALIAIEQATKEYLQNSQDVDNASIYEEVFVADESRKDSRETEKVRKRSKREEYMRRIKKEKLLRIEKELGFI